MTFKEQMEMLFDYMKISDGPVEKVPDWYQKWWTEKKENLHEHKQQEQGKGGGA